jgi:hypothetical protein
MWRRKTRLHGAFHPLYLREMANPPPREKTDKRSLLFQAVGNKGVIEANRMSLPMGMEIAYMI